MAQIWLLGRDGEAVAHGHAGQGDDGYLDQLSVENHQEVAGAWKEVVSFKCLTGAKIKVPEDMRALIASPEWLMKQRHLSLEERAAFWRDRLQLPKLSAWSIRQFYLEHGATYRKP